MQKLKSISKSVDLRYIPVMRRSGLAWFVSVLVCAMVKAHDPEIPSALEVERLAEKADLIIVGKFIPTITGRHRDMPIQISSVLKGRAPTNRVVASLTKTFLTAGSESKYDWIIFLAAPFKQTTPNEYRKVVNPPYDEGGLVRAFQRNIDLVSAALAKDSKR